MCDGCWCCVFWLLLLPGVVVFRVNRVIISSVIIKASLFFVLFCSVVFKLLAEFEVFYSSVLLSESLWGLDACPGR